ncbi:FecCD family ABC transporter permease [Enterococcus timonensis]|uniref:FecCD family ABC transporter permease n=1 Tax=Enterococcus timonensis TaxID=1852364 RepID=UPI0008D96216|nr:iron ABC transporter permease [Enterococcus timonensis]
MKRNKMFLITGGLLLACLILFYFSLTNGAVNISRATIYNALFQFDPQDQTQQIIRNLRLPRVLAAFLIGAAFAVSGALMQAITKNPLADSGLLGINSGASLGLAISFAFFPTQENSSIVFSFLGAAGAAGIIFLLTRFSRARISPVRLVLSGVAISSLFTALSQSLSLVFDLQQDLAFWFVGGVAAITWDRFFNLLPFFIVAIMGSIFLAAQLNVLTLGDETAIGLGKNPTFIRGISLFFVVLLAGTAVTMVGPISFIGLMIPHLARYFSESYRKIVPLSLLLGGFLVMLADFCSRMINPPFETPLGLLISAIGVPFLLYKVRRTT